MICVRAGSGGRFDVAGAAGAARERRGRMRCLHIISGDLWAGAETATCALLRELRSRRGIEPRAIVLNEGQLARELREADVPVQVEPERGRGLVSLARAVRRAAGEWNADVVHSHRYKEHLLAAWAVAGRPIAHVRTAHGMPPSVERSGRGAAALIDGALTRTFGGRWIAVSQELAERLRGPRRTVDVVHNGLPESPAAPRADLLRGRAGTALVGFVGRLERIKRPDRFLEILAGLGPVVGGVAVRGVVAGAGSLEAPMKAEAAARGLDGRVSFLGHVEDGAAVVAALDVLVVSSDHEGHPMVVLEAMRAGVPVVATSVGGLPEVLPRDEFLAPPDDLGALSSAVARLVADPELRRRRGAALRDEFLRTFSVRTTADRVLEVYDDAVERRRRRR